MPIANEAKSGDTSDKLVLKTAEGTRDYSPREMALRKEVLGLISTVFEQFDAECIDTPIFERREILVGQYGEEGGKLIYNLEDQEGELLSMRYDLTVPFARYCAMNKVDALKRYHIGKVYRRVQPVMSRGRYREFYQCDYYIAGQYDSMMPESECLMICHKVLSKINVGEFIIKVNHHVISEVMKAAENYNFFLGSTVQLSLIDKLDEQTWNEIVKELGVKYIPKESVKKLVKFLFFKEFYPTLTNLELLEMIKEISGLSSDKNFGVGVEELKKLIELCEIVNVKSIRFDPSLARGLDYKGVIYEAVIPSTFILCIDALEGVADEIAETGKPLLVSVATGGRYDDLVATFSPKSKVPCCGISFDVERLFAIKEAQSQKENKAIRSNATEVIVISAQKNLLLERRKLAELLRNADFKVAEFLKANPKFLNQIKYAEERQIPFAVIIGESEIAAKIVKLKNVATKEEQEVPLTDLPNVLRAAVDNLKH